MDKIISICGITCSECPCYIATQEDSFEKRKETAKKWSETYILDFKPEDINCDGCTSVSGKKFVVFSKCEIRKCGIEKKVLNCAYCKDYACDKLIKFFSMMPDMNDAKTTLDELNSALKEARELE